MAETILRMTGIQKYFPGVHALDNAQLEVREGEVMALVGENGAGKSTLMKVLTGIYPSDGGTIEFFGKQVQIHGPRDAQALGICIVHQELNLMQHLTVAENIFIGREPMKGPFVDKAKQNAMTQALFEKLHLDLDPKAVVKTLSVAKQQMVEITKALSHEHTKLLILDEPSAVLTDTEIDDLFVFIRQLKKTGVGIIYISHRMDELKRITDRITVMRDGQYVATLETPTAEISEVIRLMVGRTIYEEPKTKSMCPPDAPVVLEAEHLNSLDVKDVSFKLRKGEILGFAGLVGAGRTETMRLICGADPMDSGTIRINGKDVKIRSPKDAVRYGIGYLSEDRKRYGLCLGLSVTDNTVLPSLEQLFKGAFVNDKKADRHAQDYVEKVAAPYFAAYTRWLEEIHVGMTGGEMFDKIEEILPRAVYGWSLCPGHLVAEEEWLCSPIYEHSTEVLRSGMMLQIDIIPSVPGYGGSCAESTVVLADEALKEQICQQYPEMWQRMQARRQYIIQQLGIQLSEDVLPMCGTVAYLRPYLLDKELAFVIR